MVEDVLKYKCCFERNNMRGEVVELVYGTSLENWRAFVAFRGFESHPLRHFLYKNKFSLCRVTQEAEGDCLLNS